MKDLRIPTCMDCPCRLDYVGKAGQIQNGVRLQPFEKYCTAQRRPKLICKKGIMQKPPNWCPKLKKPCELRVYGFVNEEAETMHRIHREMLKTYSPAEYHYALRRTGTIPLTPREFWRRCNEYGADLELPVDVKLYEVVEIDDGLKPVCFCLTPQGYHPETLFDPKKIRKKE